MKLLLSLTLGIGALVGGASVSAQSEPVPQTSFQPVRPCRVLDSRLNGGAAFQGERRVDLGDCLEGVEGEVLAVAVTATVTQPASNGHATLWGDGQRPQTSNLNWSSGETRANAAVTQIVDGGFNVYTFSKAHFIVDINAVFVASAKDEAAGRYVPVTPERIIDSREDGSGRQQQRSVVFDSIPADATGVVATFTTTQTVSGGHFTAWPEGVRPLTSMLNVDGANQTRAATIMMGVEDRTVNVWSYRPEHLIVDLVGYFGTSDTGSFVPQKPTRLLDTRNEESLIWGGGSVSRNLSSVGASVLANITSVSPARDGWAHIGGAQQVTKPDVSSINFTPRRTVANAAVPHLSESGFAVYAQSASHIVVDSFGYFTGQRTAANPAISHTNEANFRSASCISTGWTTNEFGHQEAKIGSYQKVVSVPEVGVRGPVAVVGDSLTYQSAETLAVKLQQAGWGPICVDGTISRTVEFGNYNIPDGLDAVRRIRGVSSEWSRPEVVWVVPLGTNDAGFSGNSEERAARSARKLVDEIGQSDRIWWMNVKTTVSGSRVGWEAAYNAGISSLGVNVIDWYGRTVSESGHLSGDRVHLSRYGIDIRNALIVDSVRAI